MIRSEDLNRRVIPLQRRRVTETLPEFFLAEYPKFVTFLEKYYDFLDSSGQYSFNNKIEQLFATRDVDQTPDNLFDLLGKELGANLASTNIFEDKRYSIRRFGELYRNKGTAKGLEQFFRSFYQVEPSIEFPKEKVFNVGSSTIGIDGQFVLQDHRRFQTLSIAYKTPLDISTWRELYLKYAHPAGFHLAADVSLIGIGSANFQTPQVEFDSDAGVITFEETASLTATIPFNQLTTLNTDSDGIVYRANPNENVEKYEDLTLVALDSIYENLAQIFTPNSFKFSSGHKLAFDVASENIAFSNTNGTNDGPGSTTPNAGLPTLRLVGTIAEWNTGDNYNFEDYWSTVDRVGTPPNTGTMSGTSSDGYIDSGETIIVTGSNNFIAADSGEGYNRNYTTKYTVDLSDVTKITYWTNNGGGGWGNNAQSNEDLVLSFGKTLDADGTVLDASTLNTVLGGTAGLNTWNKHTITITGIADSNVYLQFTQTGTQFGDVKDNWAFTSIYVDSSYDSAAPDFSLTFETMDQEMYDSYGKAF